MPHQLNVIEALWDFISLFGIIYSARTLRKYVVSLIAAGHLRNPKDRPAAKQIVRDYLRTEASRCLCHIISFALGVQASYITPRQQPCCPTPFERFYGIELIFGFIFINLVTVTVSYLAYRIWQRRYGLLGDSKALRT